VRFLAGNRKNIFKVEWSKLDNEKARWHSRQRAFR
jgi:hypothetical protein